MKRKISKMLAVFMAILTLLTQAMPALAALTAGNKYSYTETHLNAYYSTGTWQTADGHTHNNNGQVTLRNLTSTGEPLYCIQIYEGCDGSTATAVNIKDTNLWYYELTDTAQRGITRVSIYGYPNYTYGYSRTDAQLATQVLLWEFEMDRRQGYAIKTTSFADQIFANYPNAEKCYLKIVEACANHQNSPKLSSSKVTLKGTGSNNAVTITDSNNVLSNFTVKASNDRIKASISGNKLTVYATGSGKLSGGLIFTKKNTDINSAFALTGANQTLFYGTISDPVTAMLPVELSLGTLVIHKDSEDGNKKVDFNVKGNGINKTVTTNSDGLATITDLPEGSYAVTEINKSQYHPHTEAKTAHIVAGATENVYFYNVLVKGKIEISKQGEIFSSVNENEDGTYSPIYENTFLQGAEYKIYANEDIKSGTVSVKKGTLVDTVTTNKNGKAATKDLYLNADGTAQYKIIETKAPNGYVLDTEEHIIDLKMKEDGVDVTESLKLFDARQKVSVQFNKSLETDLLFNIGNNDEMSNVKFGLYAEQEIIAADGTVIPEGALIEVISYDEIKDAIESTEENPEDSSSEETSEGTISEVLAAYSVKTDLPFGSYYIQEMETDEHYIINETKYPFSFSYTNQDEALVNIQISEGEPIENTLKRGTIQGLKLDDSNNYLAGATIGLFKADTEEFTEETALITTVSSEDGTFSFPNVPYGKYIVKEMIAPENYLLDENSYPVEITEDEQVITLEIVDVLKRGSIQGLKIDNNGNVLEGALIGLFPNGTTEFTKDTALMTDTSDKDGKFAFEDIPVGSYIVKELESPEGYILDTNEYEVNITENEQIVEIKIINTLKIGKLILTHTYDGDKSSPRTGADNTIIFISLIVAGVITLSTVAAVSVVKRRKVQK